MDRGWQRTWKTVVAMGYDGRAIAQETDMGSTNGVIKRLVADKGFGFVRADDGREYFFHQASCVDGNFDSMREGQKLTFDAGEGPKGPRAENVRIA